LASLKGHSTQFTSLAREPMDLCVSMPLLVPGLNLWHQTVDLILLPSHLRTRYRFRFFVVGQAWSTTSLEAVPDHSSFIPHPHRVLGPCLTCPILVNSLIGLLVRLHTASMYVCVLEHDSCPSRNPNHDFRFGWIWIRRPPNLTGCLIARATDASTSVPLGTLLPASSSATRRLESATVGGQREYPSAWWW